MNRRDFLRLRTGNGRVAELSLETLYMRLVDAGEGGEAEELFARIDRTLERAHALRIHQRSWLGREELARKLEPLIRRFAGRGGRVEYV